MSAWPEHPVIYEINTWDWLQELSRQSKGRVTLANVPQKEWDAIASLGVDAVWLMGVWERSPEGIRISREHPGLRAEYRMALPDYSAEDVVGSPYCVHRYVVDKHLGGTEGLAAARKKLSQKGIRLILDFVPNHVAPDHPWVLEHPDHFIQGNEDDVARAPGEFFRAGTTIIACGRDPFFPPWTDTAQLNAFHPALREAAIGTVRSIADQCDGMRCDMAMLLMNHVFERTWGSRAGSKPATEFWVEVISALRTSHPNVLFMAEAYWDLEWELQQQGFDYCYDKRLYDRLVHNNGESVRLHLLADIGYQNRLVRFIENHDEPRAAVTLPAGKQRAAALTILTLPGAKLLHEGQFEGKKIKLPVQLGRRPDEPVDYGLRSFYHALLKAGPPDIFRGSVWQLCEKEGWPDNESYLNIVAWCWKKDEDRYLVAVNLSDSISQAHVRLPWNEIAGWTWWLKDLLTDKVYERDGNEMLDPGLYVGLNAWGFHFLKFSRTP